MSEQTVYYSPEFMEDFRRICKKHKKIPEDFDRFLKLLLEDEVHSLFHMNRMKDGCRGYFVIKARKFLSKDLQSASSCRIVFARRDGNIFFIEFYEKSHKSDADIDRICKSLRTVTDGTCVGRYVKGDFPNSRALLRKNPEQ